MCVSQRCTCHPRAMKEKQPAVHPCATKKTAWRDFGRALSTVVLFSFVPCFLLRSTWYQVWQRFPPLFCCPRYQVSVLEIESEIAFANIDLHPDCLDQRSRKIGVDLDIWSRSPRSRSRSRFSIFSSPLEKRSRRILRLQVPILHHRVSLHCMVHSCTMCNVHCRALCCVGAATKALCCLCCSLVAKLA